MDGRRPWRAMLAASLVGASALGACGTSDGEPGAQATFATVDAADLAAAATLQVSDLAGGEDVGEWAVSDEASTDDPDDPIDGSLPGCIDLTATEPGLSESLEASETSESFEARARNATYISLLARNAAFVYGDDEAASNAFDLVDAEMLAACVATSVDPDAADAVELDVDEGSSDTDAKVFAADLDDSVFFDGNDNTHVVEFHVVRVGPAVVVAQFVASGQYFEGFRGDLSALQQASVDSVTTRLEALAD